MDSLTFSWVQRKLTHRVERWLVQDHGLKTWVLTHSPSGCFFPSPLPAPPRPRFKEALAAVVSSAGWASGDESHLPKVKSCLGQPTSDDPSRHKHKPLWFPPNRVTLMGSPGSRAPFWDHPDSVGPSSQINWPFPQFHFLLLPRSGTNP